MSINFDWKIEQLLVDANSANRANVVTTAAWRCTGKSVVDGEEFVSGLFGKCEFDAPTDSFTNYDQLSQEQVLGWCFAMPDVNPDGSSGKGINKAAIESKIEQQILSRIQSQKIEQNIPWN